MKFTSKYKSLMMGCGVALAATSPAFAQLEEIIVTAQKRAESLQDTPVAVSAFTSADLQAKGIDNIAQVADFTPNLTYDTTASVSGASSASVIFIRGIGQNDFSVTTDPGVGTYIDGVYSSRSIGGVLDVLDVERIEVLRGPQGTLFGRNTIGGAINITSRKPAEELGGSVELTVGSSSRTDFRGSIDVPFADNFRSNFAVSSKQRDGFVELVNQPGAEELGNEDRQAFRAAFVYEPSESVDISLTVDAGKVDEANAPSVLVGATASAGSGTADWAAFLAGGGTGASFPFPASQADPNGNPYIVQEGDDRSFSDFVGGTDLDTSGYALTVAWAGDNFEFKSITAGRSTDGEFNRDPDNSPAVITHTRNPDYDHEQFTQEFQVVGSLGAIDYVAGVYYFEEEATDNVFVEIGANAPPFPSGFALLNNKADVDNESTAIYLQGTYNITENLGLTLGVRNTEDEKTYAYDQFISNSVDGPRFVELIDPAGGGGPGVVSDDFSETTGTFGIDYKFDDGSLFYAKYSEGFKSGGFNIRYVVPRAEPLSFDPESLKTFELGYKWQGFDDKVRLNSAIFTSDYEDIQVVLFETGGGPLIQNAGEAEINGLELELTYAPSDNLLLNVGYGYTDAEYTALNFPTTALASEITLDSKLPNTPESKFNISGAYTIPFAAGNLVISADYVMTDDIENDAQNSPFLSQDSTDVWNAAVTFTNSADTWDIIVFGENVTDERYIVAGDSNFGLGFHEAVYNRPEEYGATFRYRFN